MADRNARPRGAPAPNPIIKFLPIVIIVIGAAIAAYFFLPRGGTAPAPGASTAPGATTGTADTSAPAATAPELSKEQLLKEASAALREQRYVSPAGNNALEYYLRVLDKDPNNQSAKDGLREMFPFATPVVEQNINTGNVDEALREIDTLAKADPSNYTLTILRGKLDAKRKQVENEQKAQAAAAAAAAARANAPAATPTAPTQSPAETTAAAAPAPGAQHAAPAATPAATAAATPPPAPAPAPAAPVGETRSAELVKSAAPEYPREAFIKHTEGWVEVEFTVTPEGTVANASVASANPPRVFNDAALRAVQRWTFKPKLENGKPTEERMKRRIEFKLGAG